MATNETDLGRSALILYATETGTSQDIAEELGRLTRRLHFSTVILGLDDVAATELSEYSVAMFVVATTGQGEFPSNAKKFWTSLLKKKLSPDHLSNVQFALVGLGDSSYPKFNWAARKLERRLTQLGAENIIESCEADEQGDEGIDGAFLAWSQSLRPLLLQRYPLPNGKEPIPEDVTLPNPWILRPLDINGNGHVVEEKYKFPSSRPDHDTRPRPGANRATLEKNDRVTPSDHWQDVRLLTLSTVEDIDYLPGDALAILPKNFAQDVDSLITQMHWTDVADIPIMFMPTAHHTPHINKPPTSPIPFLPTHHHITLRGLLTDYLDITAIPRRSFFATIASYTTNPLQKSRLLEFTNPEFLDEYHDYATRPRRSIREILQEFDSVLLPWSEIANIFPVLRPRQFSITSGGYLRKSPIAGSKGTKFELLVAIVKYRTVIRKIREGVCTRYLAALAEGSTLNVALRTEGRFHAKKEDIVNTNHLLIGAGTGIAPLRALVLEKEMLSYTLLQPKESTTTVSTALFFGVRNKNADYFFNHEWPASQSSSSRSTLKVFIAFSRDQPSKIYVQDLLKEQKDIVYEFIQNKNATVIVCGSSGQMPRAVRDVLEGIIWERWRDEMKEKQGVDRDRDRDLSERAGELFARLEKMGRYKQETW